MTVFKYGHPKYWVKRGAGEASRSARRALRTGGRNSTKGMSDDPVAWLMFRWYDWILIVVLLVMAAVINPNGALMGTLATIAAVWYFLVWPFFVLVPRMRRRRRWCLDHGHSPYRTPEGELVCAWCREPLDEDAGVAAPAASSRGQARWSDRR